MVYCQIDLKKETAKPDKMDIKDGILLNRMTWASADEIEYNTIVAFQTCNSNTSGYYIAWWIVNEYTLQEKYTCYAFNPLVIIPEGELFCLDKFITAMRKTSYCYRDLDEAIPVMVKLKQGVMLYI